MAKMNANQHREKLFKADLMPVILINLSVIVIDLLFTYFAIITNHINKFCLSHILLL